MGGEFQINHATRFTNACAHLTPPKKHVLNYFDLEMAAIVVAEQRACNRKERIFSTCINLFGMQEEHENIVCQAMLFLICFRK